MLHTGVTAPGVMLFVCTMPVIVALHALASANE
jgi:hypothetical protein